MSAKVTLIQEGNWTALGQLGAALGTFLGIKILTSLLDSSSYGMIALALTGVAFIHQILVAPLSSAVERFFPELTLKSAQPVSNYLRLILWCGAIAACALAGILYLKPDMDARKQLCLVSCAFIISSSVNYFLGAALNSQRLRKDLAILQSSSEWLRYGFAGVFAFLSQGSFIWTMYGFFIGSLCAWSFSSRTAIPKLFKIHSNSANKTFHQVLNDCLRYAWPFCLWGAFTWIHYASDRWALALFGDLSLVGRYAALYQLGYYPQIILSGVILQLIAPIAYQMARVKGYEDHSSTRAVQRAFVFSILCALIFSFVVWLFCESIYPVLVGQNFAADAHYWPIFVLAGGLFSAGQSASLKKMVSMETSHLIKPKIMTALLGTVLNIVLVFFFGFVGAVFSLLIFSLLYCCWMTKILFISEFRDTLQARS